MTTRRVRWIPLQVDPLTGNRYMYAGANPAGLLDDGHSALSPCWGRIGWCAKDDSDTPIKTIGTNAVTFAPGYDCVQTVMDPCSSVHGVPGLPALKLFVARGSCHIYRNPRQRVACGVVRSVETGSQAQRTSAGLRQSDEVTQSNKLHLTLESTRRCTLPGMGLKVSELAHRAGVSTDAIRYYEGLGLLKEADRTAAGYRQFGEEAVKRILFIKDAQSLGLRLNEIGELLAIQDDGACPCGHTKTLVERRLEQVNRELEVLNSLKAELERLAALECYSPAGSSVWPCEIDLKKGGDLDG
ncbi:hypothetical protein BH23ACT12_BH23ACT12_07510 [soil metagenome]